MVFLPLLGTWKKKNAPHLDLLVSPQVISNGSSVSSSAITDKSGLRRRKCPDRMSRKTRTGTTTQWRKRRVTDTIKEEKIVLAPNERSVGAIAKESPVGLEKVQIHSERREKSGRGAKS